MNFIDFNSTQNLKKSILHEWKHNDNLENLITFKRFVNWLSEEFTLFLQDDTDALTVFFPNGWFAIKELESANNHIKFEIEVKSKCLKKGAIIFKQTMAVLNHFKALTNKNYRG